MNRQTSVVPWSDLAREIVASRLGDREAKIERFKTGLSHYVVAVETTLGTEYVIRIALPERQRELADGLMWHRRLDDLGVPLPAVHDSGELEGFTFAMYERLPGDDLENVYSCLSTHSKSEIAASLAWVKERVGNLPKAYLDEYPNWLDAVGGILDRSAGAIKGDDSAQSFFDIARELADTAYATYLTSIEPVAFLYDLNVRNVIIRDGRMTGIIDVDEIWDGDPLLAVGRGKALLLGMRRYSELIDYWCAHLELSGDMVRVVDLYALLYCIRFMATSGQILNGNYSIQTDPEDVPIFKAIAESLVGTLN